MQQARETPKEVVGSTSFIALPTDASNASMNYVALAVRWLLSIITIQSLLIVKNAELLPITLSPTTETVQEARC
jgi:hypothetical protein